MIFATDAFAAQADFDNYRKRIEKERTEDSTSARRARVIEGLIPVIDGFRALRSLRTAKGNTRSTARLRADL